MRSPLPPAERDVARFTTTTDAEALGAATAVGEEVHSTFDALHLRPATRRSEYSSAPVGVTEAWDVLAPIVTARSAWAGADGYIEQQTLVPSAGARQPLTALLVHKAAGTSGHRAWAVSPSTTPTRFEVTDHHAEVQRVLQATAHAVRAVEVPSTVIVVLARFRRTLSKYPDGQSLVWRDAGAFLTMAHLVAATLGLQSCIVGITETTRFPLRGAADDLVDVGALTLSKGTT